MALFGETHVWTSRPQFPVGISPAWKDNVIQAFQCAPSVGAYDSATGLQYNSYTAPSYDTDGIRFDANAEGLYLVNPALATNSYTVILIAKRLGANTAYASYIGSSYNGDNTTPYGDQVDPGATTGTDLRFAYNAGGSAQAITATGGGLSTTQFDIVAYTFTSGSQKLYKNGVQIASASTAGNPTWIANSRFGLGCQDNLARNPNIIVRFAARLNYAATLAEINSITQNPWQIFQPLKREIYVGVASGATTHAATGALSASSATVSGTAANIAKHAATGALAAQSATISGTAARVTVGTHDAVAELLAGSSIIAGTAAHIAKHAATGTLAAQSAVIVGAAARSGVAIDHAAIGALVAESASIGGVGAIPAVWITAAAASNGWTDQGAASSGWIDQSSASGSWTVN